MEMGKFFEKYKDEMKHFGMLSKAEESQKYLKERLHLVCEHLASYLIVWCVDLEVEGVSFFHLHVFLQIDFRYICLVAYVFCMHFPAFIEGNIHF